jgi:hypothetical protein
VVVTEPPVFVLVEPPVFVLVEPPVALGVPPVDPPIWPPVPVPGMGVESGALQAKTELSTSGATSVRVFM